MRGSGAPAPLHPSVWQVAAGSGGGTTGVLGQETMKLGPQHVVVLSTHG